MVNEQMADILATLGQHISEIIGGNPDGTYLYAEADAGFQEAGIFKDSGSQILYFGPDDELFQAIDRVWQAAEPGKQWAVMQYEVKGSSFDARFSYPDSLDPDGTSYDRRESAIKKRFGDKPVIYPPPDESFHELTEHDLSAD